MTYYRLKDPEKHEKVGKVAMTIFARDLMMSKDPGLRSLKDFADCFDFESRKLSFTPDTMSHLWNRHAGVSGNRIWASIPSGIRNTFIDKFFDKVAGDELDHVVQVEGAVATDITSIVNDMKLMAERKDYTGLRKSLKELDAKLSDPLLWLQVQSSL